MSFHVDGITNAELIAAVEWRNNILNGMQLIREGCIQHNLLHRAGPCKGCPFDEFCTAAWEKGQNTPSWWVLDNE